LHITTEGQQEFSLLSYTANDDNLLIGEVQLHEQPTPTPMNTDYKKLSQKLAILLQYVEPNITYSDKQMDNADWVCNRLIELLPLSAESKYELLQLPNNTSRLNALAGLQIEFSNAQ